MLIDHAREKLINAIIYFRNEASACDRLKLYQLLYHLDFRHYAQTGRSVTGLEYFAWPEGPVPVDIEVEIGALTEEPKSEFDPDVFTKREMKLVREIVEELGLSLPARRSTPRASPAIRGSESLFWRTGGERRSRSNTLLPAPTPTR